MSKRIAAALALVAIVAAGLFLAAAPQGSEAVPTPRPPKGFFGIGPQTALSEQDAEYMAAGGIETVRWPVAWSAVQPSKRGGYNWSGVDETMLVAARHGLQVLPFLVDTPHWVARKGTTLPIDNAKARKAWTLFVEAAVKRYGPGGEFWALHAPGAVQYEAPIRKPLPVRAWQVWNEANFFYFAYPASPQRYARLLNITSPVIKRVDPGAKVILSGLFGEPTAKGSRGMPAAEFLRDIYAIPGEKSKFDGVALHPYALDSEVLEELVEELHEVTVENHDRVPLYITEMGWGSQNDFNTVAFEQGIQGQVRELKAAYTYLLQNRTRLDLKSVFWFSWKDLPESCSFCDSVGLFKSSLKMKPKPAWRAFVALTHGRARP